MKVSVNLSQPLDGEIFTKTENVPIKFSVTFDKNPKSFTYSISYVDENSYHHLIKSAKLNNPIFFNNKFDLSTNYNFGNNSLGIYGIYVRINADGVQTESNIAKIKIVNKKEIIPKIQTIPTDLFTNKSKTLISLAGIIPNITLEPTKTLTPVDILPGLTLAKPEIKINLFSPTYQQEFMVDENIPVGFNVKLNFKPVSTSYKIILENIDNKTKKEIKAEKIELIEQDGEIKGTFITDFSTKEYGKSVVYIIIDADSIKAQSNQSLIFIKNEIPKQIIFTNLFEPQNLQKFTTKDDIPIKFNINVKNFPKIASYKIILTDLSSQEKTVIEEKNIDFFNLVPGAGLGFKTTISTIFKPKTYGQYEVYVLAEADSIKATSNAVMFNIILDTGNLQAEIVPDEKNIVFQAPLLKTFLYKKLKNKVLFQIDKFFPVINYDFFNFKDLQEKKQYAVIADIVKKNFYKNNVATIYKADSFPNNFSEIVNKSNVYKTLLLDNGELSFDDTLEVNKDYYFLVEAKHNSSNLSALNLLIKNNNLSIGNFESYSQIQKIKIIKDEDLYFIENKTIAKVINISFGKNKEYALKFYDFIDEEKTKIISKKIFIEPKFKFSSTDLLDFSSEANGAFILSSDAFDSTKNNKFIKLRLTSKKSNRKIDLNLNYNFLPSLQPIKYLEEIENKDNQKLNMILVIKREKINQIQSVGIEYSQQLNFFLQEFRNYLLEYNTTYNSNINEIVDDKEGIVFTNFYGLAQTQSLLLKFLEYKKKNAIITKLPVAVAEQFATTLFSIMIR